MAAEVRPIKIYLASTEERWSCAPLQQLIAQALEESPHQLVGCFVSAEDEADVTLALLEYRATRPPKRDVYGDLLDATKGGSLIVHIDVTDY